MQTLINAFIQYGFNIKKIYLTTVVRSPDGSESSQAVKDDAIRLILNYERLCKEGNVSNLVFYFTLILE